jgi:PKD repeat protein
MMSSRRNMLSLIAVLTVLALFAWVSPGQTEAYTIDPEIRGGWQPGPEAYHPSRVIVRFSDSVTTNAATDSIQRLGYSVYRVADFKPTAAFPSGVRFGIVELPEGVGPDTAISRLGNAPEILYAERDYIRYKDQAYMDTPIVPNDPHFARMWGLHNENLPDEYADPRLMDYAVDDADIDAPEAWAQFTGSSEVIVAVIDTGCYIDHPDLAGNIWINEAELNGNPGVDDDDNGYIDDIYGWDFYNNDNTVFDSEERDEFGYLSDDHGTHCAGTIGAMTNNGIGISGINWNTRIMVLKFIGPDGGYTSDAILALEYAAQNGASVASCSWGSEGDNQTLKEAIEASGMLAICAAGNTGADNDTNPHYPSSYDLENIISVAASGQNDKPCEYPGWWSTCYGAETVDLFAPGGFILSTLPPDPVPSEPAESYGYMYGTSMATPHVSGVAALMIGKHPAMPLCSESSGATPGDANIKEMILKTVDKKPDFGGKCVTGGRLNAAHALLLTKPPVITVASAEPTNGRPPLHVMFDAAAEDMDGEIVDVWWDFGDGSPEIHEYQTVHVYETEGFFVASFHAKDDDGVESVATIGISVLVPPSISVMPTMLESFLTWGETETKQVTIGNEGEGDLIYQIEVHYLEPSHVKPLSSENQMWITLSHTEGTVSPGGSDIVDVTLTPDGLIHGDYEALLVVHSNDPQASEVLVELVLHVHSLIPPEIKFISATPWAGPAPLSVEFSADAEDCDGDIVDIIWEFGDGTEPKQGALSVTHVYNADGEYCACLTVTDDDGLSSQDATTIHVGPLPEIGVDPILLSVPVRAHRLHNETITVINTGDVELCFDAQAMQHENEHGSSRHASKRDEQEGQDELRSVVGKLAENTEWLSVEPSSGLLGPGERMNLTVGLDLSEVGSGRLEGAILLTSNDLLDPEVAVPVRVDVIENDPPVITACGVSPTRGSTATQFEFVAAAYDNDGSILDKYWDFGDGTGPVYDFTAKHFYSNNGIYEASFHAIDNDGYEATSKILVRVEELPSASWAPRQLFFNVAEGGETSAMLTLSNEGPGQLVFGRHESNACLVDHRWLVNTEDITSPNTLTLEGVAVDGHDSSRSQWLPDRVGEIIDSWLVPAPMVAAYGVGVNHTTGNLVLSDPRGPRDYVVTPEGEYTGVQWDCLWADLWAGDMAFDGQYMWQINIGGDNGIYQLDPDTGAVVNSISNKPWTRVSQRGLAYSTNDDTFYVGGWNDNMIYHIKGLSWDDPGAVLDSWSMPVGIAGLAYHPGADILAVANNGNPDMIWFIDPSTHAVLAEFPHPASTEFGYSYGGAGIAFDANGNLWTANLASGKMFLLRTGFGPFADWVALDPADGVVEPGGSVEIKVTPDTSTFGPGEHTTTVILPTNDIEYPAIFVPVHLNVASLPSILELSATPTIGEPPLEVTFKAIVSAPETPFVSCKWTFGDGSSADGLEAVHVYEEEGSYVATFTAIDALGGRVSESVNVDVKLLPRASVDPSIIRLTLPFSGISKQAVAIGNVLGNASLEFEIRVMSGSAPQPGYTKPLVSDTLGFPFEPKGYASSLSAYNEADLGDVLISWPMPESIELGYGVGFDGRNLWISDLRRMVNHLVTPQGLHTGVEHATSWAHAFATDMAYDPTRNVMWQVNVGGDNGIYGMDVATGSVVHKITSGIWTRDDQRGLAYDCENDTFYIGGWNERIIYHIKGLSWDNPGEALDQWSFPVAIAGLAWHPDGVLWVTDNSTVERIYAVDPVTHVVLHEFDHPGKVPLGGAGLSIHEDGNLWAVSQKEKRVYLVNTGMPISGGVTFRPNKGEISPGESQEIAVAISASELGEPGETVHKYLQIETNDPFCPVLYVDIVLEIEVGPTIHDARVSTVIGEPPLRVDFSASVTPGDAPIVDYWWDFGDGTEAVHEQKASYTYYECGTFHPSFHVVDANGAHASEQFDIDVRRLPSLEVMPSNISTVVPIGGEAQDIITISNTGNAAMSFALGVAPNFSSNSELHNDTMAALGYEADKHELPACEVEGAGGPDSFGYVWADSDEPNGPVFEWIEISDTGTRIPLKEDSGWVIELPFEFPYYGASKNRIGVSSKGYLCFDERYLQGFQWNMPIPSIFLPNDMIAVFWCDLDPSASGSVWYHYDQKGDRVIIEFKDVPRLGSPESSYTFQVVMTPNGNITFQYLHMVGDVCNATVGIEDPWGTDGLQVTIKSEMCCKNSSPLLEHVCIDS